jgi:hypothetical protein
MTPIDANVRSEHSQLLSDLKQRESTLDGRTRSAIETVARKFQLALAAKKKLDWTSSRRGLCSDGHSQNWRL